MVISEFFIFTKVPNKFFVLRFIIVFDFNGLHINIAKDGGIRRYFSNKYLLF